MTKLASWTGELRIDGARVEQARIGHYDVIGPNAAWTLRICPCCDKPFTSARAAMLTADVVFPVQDPDPRLEA